MALDGWGEVCAAKEESKICVTCPIAAVFCDSANVAEISNPSMAKTAVAFGIYNLLRCRVDASKFPIVPWGNEQGQHRFRCWPCSLPHLWTKCPEVNRDSARSAAGPLPVHGCQRPHRAQPPHAGCPGAKNRSSPSRRSHSRDRHCYSTARRDRRPACPMADRGRELARPTCGAGVCRSFSVERSHRAPAARLPALCSGPPPFRCGEVYISLSTNQDTFALIPSGETAKIKKFFFMRSKPRLIDWRTDSSCTPSASAISLMLMPRMI